ncbi:response regulator transcription factor [Hymenobacter sp. 5516J-16]|uniref:Response regulator transcription factor n=1 Tax=Hymenobacter sublimis TaxID=2933777 RepID=A0ABY4JAV1_9BACT|nr:MULTISPECIES: response regulator transcription factor [Hymenobacter]UOQ76275.1 response regulator transcription factor [Hymenobacter sp. 5516J-16]UPL49948.1 response regulator transcription factor [Hymenobacter sublimis]
MSATTIRLAVVDDHILFRKGLRALISGFPGMEVLFEAGDGQELLERLDQGNMPDVVLMDLQMPVLDGLQTVRLLRAQYPQVRAIIISMHDEPELIDSLRAEGAHGYLLKNASPEEVRGAIQSVFDNRPNPGSSRTLLTASF